MSEENLSKEERILRMMRRVLTDIARETYTRPGLRHPLSEITLLNMRDCLALIAARERELAEAAGRPSRARPRYADEPRPTSVVVSLDTGAARRKDGPSEDG